MSTEPRWIGRRAVNKAYRHAAAGCRSSSPARLRLRPAAFCLRPLLGRLCRRQALLTPPNAICPRSFLARLWRVLTPLPRDLVIARSCLLPTAFCLLLSLAGCGYRVAGRGDRLPPDVKTVAVPIFTNETSRFRIEQRVAAAVTREFIERTNFRITPDPAEADAVLQGTIKEVRSGVVAFDLSTGRATTLQIQVLAQVELTDLHTKKVLFSNPNYLFREQYQISQTTAALFEEEQPALDRLARDLARTLVTEILENF